MSTPFYPNNGQRVAIFIDVQNMFYSAKTLHQSKIDYSKLLETIVSGRQLVRAIAYIVQKPDVDQTSFLDALDRLGYEIKAKELRIRPDGTSKGDWGMEIAIDALTLAPKVDTTVLVTGDGDFVPLVYALRAQGCRMEVVSFDRSTSTDLIRAADRFIPIDTTVLFKEPKFMQDNSYQQQPPQEGGDDFNRSNRSYSPYGKSTYSSRQGRDETDDGDDRQPIPEGDDIP
ncbi:MAG TPA: NYN domain-containing protein [Candidatus Brocadiia bacterium]|nr:NYN domain-containing protein [Candidatus Brocadiia bacterium]